MSREKGMNVVQISEGKCARNRVVDMCEAPAS